MVQEYIYHITSHIIGRIEEKKTGWKPQQLSPITMAPKYNDNDIKCMHESETTCGGHSQAPGCSARGADGAPRSWVFWVIHVN